MTLSPQKRIDQAWESCKGWITEFDGSPTVTLLVNVPPDALLPGLSTLAQKSENFRITSISAQKPALPQFIPLESLPENLALLRDGKLAELSINYAARLEAMDLDIHLVVHPLENQKVSLELDWWSDQVFSEEEDNEAQFKALMGYFIELQALFSASNLFASPESGKDPRQAAESWVEI